MRSHWTSEIFTELEMLVIGTSGKRQRPTKFGEKEKDQRNIFGIGSAGDLGFSIRRITDKPA
jgi:hypothetical protein